MWSTSQHLNLEPESGTMMHFFWPTRRLSHCTVQCRNVPIGRLPRLCLLPSPLPDHPAHSYAALNALLRCRSSLEPLQVFLPQYPLVARPVTDYRAYHTARDLGLRVCLSNGVKFLEDLEGTAPSLWSSRCGVLLGVTWKPLGDSQHLPLGSPVCRRRVGSGNQSCSQSSEAGGRQDFHRHSTAFLTGNLRA